MKGYVNNTYIPMGKKLHSIRKVKKMGIRSFSSLLGVSRSLISCVENGKRKFTPKLLSLCEKKLEPKLYKYLEDYNEFLVDITVEEYNLIMLLRKVPEMRSRIITGIKNKILMSTKDHIEYSP